MHKGRDRMRVLILFFLALAVNGVSVAHGQKPAQRGVVPVSANGGVRFEGRDNPTGWDVLFILKCRPGLDIMTLRDCICCREQHRVLDCRALEEE